MPHDARLCCDCAFFVRVPFTVGSCGRRDISYGPSIVDERTEGACGQDAKFYKPKRASAA